MGLLRVTTVGAVPRVTVSVLSNVTADDNKDNPFVHLMSDALRRHDVRVDRVTFGLLRRGHRTVFHLQWPELYFARPEGRRALKGAARMTAYIAMAKAAHVPLVLTMHNLESHRTYHPRLERWCWRLLARSASGCVHLSEAAFVAALARYPRLRECDNVVIPHPLYPSGGLPTRAEARKALDIPSDATVALHFGLLRRYKGTLTLVDAFRALPDPSARLVIAGRVHEPGYGGEITAHARDDRRISLLLSRLDDAELDLWIAASDVAVFPFQRILNSGSVLYALSRRCRVLVPRSAAMDELIAEFGRDWVKTFDVGQLTPQILRAAFADAGTAAGNVLGVSPQRTWASFAARLADWYGILLG